MNNFNKKALLDHISWAIKSKLVSVEEVFQVAKASQPNIDKQDTKQDTKQDKTQNTKQDGISLLIKVFAILGGVVVFLGCVFFARLIWGNIGDFGHILITFVLGLIFYISGTFLLNLKAPRFIGLSVHLVACLLIPGGVFVILDKLPPLGADDSMIVSLVFLCMAVIYIITDFFLKGNLFTIFTIIFGSMSYIAGVAWIGDLLNLNVDIWFHIFGIVYTIPLIVLGRLVKDGLRRQTFKFFEGWGYLVLFISIFGLFEGEGMLEAMSAFIFILGIVIGSQIRSISLLTYGFIAVTLFILYVNLRYFAGLDYWPLALIFSGFILLLSSYLFSIVKKKILESS
jgi:hypothetical protein